MGHSLSADYLNDLFDSQGIGVRYVLQKLDDLSALRPWLGSNPTIVGLNVTSPYKAEVCNYLDHIDPGAKYVEAINTTVADRTGGRVHLSGYNTDVQGVVETLQPLLMSEQQHALVLGADGTAQAVAQALKRLGRNCTLASRDPQAPYIPSCSDLTPELVADKWIIINATLVGMGAFTTERPRISYGVITPEHLCVDLIYNPEKTRFPKACREQGTTTINGLKILPAQARYAWHIWNRQA